MLEPLARTVRSCVRGKQGGERQGSNHSVSSHRRVIRVQRFVQLLNPHLKLV
jgi:hypothetical protein